MASMPEALTQSGADVAKGQSRNFRRHRQRRVMIAVALTTLVAAMLLAIAFFALMRTAGG
jgi:ABC-type enterobactin transport system permease subunit